MSFFPKPSLFFWSVVLWTAICMGGWYGGGENLGYLVGLPNPADDAPDAIGVLALFTPPFLWFYIYYAVAIGLFAGFWRLVSPHPWFRWSVLGSALILFLTYFQVQLSVALNSWYGPFYDLIQAALSKTKTVTLPEFYGQLATFFYIAFVYVTIGVLTDFFVSHYIFRWRDAMNSYYMANWPNLRRIEGAAQRVQEDTMRFSSTLESLGVSLINSVMTLIAFVPVLLKLSENVTEIPFFGAIPYSLVFAAVIWSIFGTAFLATIGIKLPGLQFRNQRVEAAYRKELVYGEDDETRAQPPTVRELFNNVRRNYFTIYFHYMYFNIGRYFYLQFDVIFPLILLAPTIVAGKITFGIFRQISNAFEQVRSSFQYLITSWTTIIELISIYKRLRAFEASIAGTPILALDRTTVAGS